MKRTRLMALVMAAVMALAIALPALADEAVPEVTLYLAASSGTTANADNPVLDAIEEATGVRLQTFDPGGSRRRGNQAQHHDCLARTAGPVPRGQHLGQSSSLSRKAWVCLWTTCWRSMAPTSSRKLATLCLRLRPIRLMETPISCSAETTDYTSNLNVRVDWLKNLGLEMPTDLDSLYDVLYAFTYDDPDGNGQQDTVGIVMPMAQYMQWDNLFGAFGICFEKNYLMEDGTVTTYMKAPTYLQAIEYLRKLYQNGVMDPDFATMPAMTAHERLWTGRCGVYGFQSVGPTNNWYPGRYTEDMPEDPAEVFGFANIVSRTASAALPSSTPT